MIRRRSVRVCDPAGNLTHTERAVLPSIEGENLVFVRRHGVGKVAEQRRGVVAVLTFALGIIDAFSKEPARRSRLEASHFEATLEQFVDECRDPLPVRPPVDRAIRCGSDRA